MGYQGGALVLFGESSAYPHGLPHPRSLQENQVVLIDGGTSVHGYQSDMTRTTVFGKPDPEAEKVFAILQNAQKQALEHGVKWTGCTVHFVDETLDGGRIILQRVVPIHEDDTVETLSARILIEEHRLYAEALDQVLRKRSKRSFSA